MKQPIISPASGHDIISKNSAGSRRRHQSHDAASSDALELRRAAASWLMSWARLIRPDAPDASAMAGQMAASALGTGSGMQDREELFGMMAEASLQSFNGTHVLKTVDRLGFGWSHPDDTARGDFLAAAARPAKADGHGFSHRDFETETAVCNFLPAGSWLYDAAMSDQPDAVRWIAGRVGEHRHPDLAFPGRYSDGTFTPLPWEERDCSLSQETEDILAMAARKNGTEGDIAFELAAELLRASHAQQVRTLPRKTMSSMKLHPLSAAVFHSGPETFSACAELFEWGPENPWIWHSCCDCAFKSPNGAAFISAAMSRGLRPASSPAAMDSLCETIEEALGVSKQNRLGVSKKALFDSEQWRPARDALALEGLTIDDAAAMAAASSLDVSTERRFSALSGIAEYAEASGAPLSDSARSFAAEKITAWLSSSDSTKPLLRQTAEQLLGNHFIAMDARIKKTPRI